MSKKKKTAPIPQFCDDALADSPLVRLVKEYEALTEERERLSSLIQEHRESITAAKINFDTSVKYNSTKIDHYERALRTNSAALQNVNELINLAK